MLSSPWLLVIAALIGFALGGTAVYPVATWKERAVWASASAEQTKELSARLKAENERYLAAVDRFNQAVTQVQKDNDKTQETVLTMVNSIGGMSSAIQSVRNKLSTVPVGNCSFSDDADKLRRAAYEATAGSVGVSGDASAGKAKGSNAGTGSGAGSRAPGPAPHGDSGPEGG